MNKGLAQLRQNGVIARMKSDWWYDSPQCTFDSSKYTSPWPYSPQREIVLFPVYLCPAPNRAPIEYAHSILHVSDHVPQYVAIA